MFADAYDVVRPIASGGMASVSLARRKRDGLLVAVKRAHSHGLHGEHEGEGDHAFDREVRLASRVVHPNVAAVVEAFPAERILVMEYVDGGSLAALVELEDPPPPPIVFRILLDAALGVAAIHDARIVHRDVSPSNVLVGNDGVARLIDFGLARAIALPAVVTGALQPLPRSPALQGTFAYLPPEYVDGGRVLPAGDVFALGVLAWELLAGKRLFWRGNDAATLVAIVEGDIPPLEGVLPAIADLVQAALEKEPARRPTARGFARAWASACGVSSGQAACDAVADAERVGAFVRAHHEGSRA